LFLKVVSKTLKTKLSLKVDVCTLRITEYRLWSL
jgi:hypothetical protein